VLAVGLLLAYLWSEREGAAEAVRAIGVGYAVASLAAVLVGLLASMSVWRALLADLGAVLSPRAAFHVFFFGQLGKYVPGSVFAVAAQMELGRAQGASRSRVATASLLFMGVGLAVGLLVAAATLPFTSPGALRQFAWVLLVLPVGLAVLAPPVLTRVVGVFLRLLRRPPLEAPLTARRVGAATGWALVMWLAYGLHLWLLVRPQGADAGGDLLLATGGYALAWTAGFLFVIAPAGAGVREVALVAALAPVVDRPAALAVALLSRVLMTLGDLVLGAGGAAVRPRNGHGTGRSGTGVSSVTAVKQLGKAADA
jgi:uncharacterized membrane protein YbhN (UPF0104 family)